MTEPHLGDDPYWQNGSGQPGPGPSGLGLPPHSPGSHQQQGSYRQPQQPPYQQGPYQQGPYGPTGQPPLSDADAQLWSMLSHVGVIVTGFIGPLIIWAVFKDRNPLVRQNAAAATNFGFLMAIGYVVGSILLVVVVGGLVMAAAAVLAIIFGIIGAVRANNGEVYSYPFNVKWIK
ncbi:hypothetical protein GCM10011575_23270 [Microlunatus endophyticus]|uniref:DUF4870 domain-containing protein n=1 Tax=Microlunatus endophyticus TaxID=1716077 RepID=A0A917W3K6_9ACTN|nr:DUF4870 domain-containing protein [Microlunatus endophyticus]GGL64177.1 hypothetical protein GCM10011575_23270 [Microlunatus endophyticus]